MNPSRESLRAVIEEALLRNVPLEGRPIVQDAAGRTADRIADALIEARVVPHYEREYAVVRLGEGMELDEAARQLSLAGKEGYRASLMTTCGSGVIIIMERINS